MEANTDSAHPLFGHGYLVRVVGLYVLFSFLWIFVSDKMLVFLIQDPEIILWLGMVKGWLFILITTGMLYWLISRCFSALIVRDREILALNADLERRESKRTAALEAQIAERWWVEGELRLSEARYRLLAEKSIDVIWALNGQGELTYISPSVERVLGYSREEYLRLPPTKTYTPAAWEIDQEGVRQGLDLELTESILLQGEEAMLAMVADWKARGTRWSIDDFGTGYSSLAYLKRFNVDKIKIDRSFIVNLVNDEGDRAIVQAMIQIARSLNLKTLAEGVEDAGLANQLHLMGCDEAQGYLYARPVPATDWTGAYAQTASVEVA